MKNRSLILIAVIMAMLVCTPVFAAITATIGDQNSSGDYRVEVDSDGVFKFQNDTSILFPYQSGTTNDTLTAADSGRTYVVTSGAVSAVILKFPPAAVGMEFPIVSATTELIYLNPNGTDIINYASLAAGDAIYNSSSAKGDSITLFCVTAGEWSVKNAYGTWADGNSMGD